ncbi:phosphatidylglycerophosphatase A [Thermovibrio guaymasensis]|uniref:Phosphatidylglycerophosphatase A n=1 Tax=Thermovibrio guaymasensis TaxID=240167 RepID=A0A420W5K0_9BACT|nr:phosphatidylglycerophosphatase A [Thermovibrio guaymasensis]RKQ60343.1 phosphatidylglycerophosphatase A [Thermovibrio guaymasensis]
MNWFMEFLATGFYSGKLPKMPGTWGSIFAAVLAYFLWPSNPDFQVLVILITFFLSVVSSDYLARKLGDKDPDQVVIDEVLGVEITFFLLNPQGDLELTLAGLILFRIIDIMKPFPIRLFERLPGGWGITVDDAVAGVLANILLRVIGGFL